MKDDPRADDGDAASATEMSALLHVGYIKTATTFLQNTVFKGDGGDLELAAGRRTREQLVENVLLADDYDFDPALIRATLDAVSAPVRARGRLPVWSEEMLLGNPASRRYDGFANARKLRAVFPDAGILITIRKQQSIAMSMYAEYVLGGGPLPLRTFIGTGDEPPSFSAILRPEFLFFDRAVRHYRALFGANRVLVLPQEMLLAASGDFVAALSRFTGAGIALPPSSRRDHASEGRVAAGLRRRLNRFALRDPTRPGRGGYSALMNRGVRLVDRLDPGLFDARLAARRRLALEARYDGLFAASNRALAEMTGLDLGGMGYDV